MFKNKKIRIDCELQSASACVFRVCKKIPSRGITHTQWRMHAHTLTVHFCSWRRRLGCNACVCVRVRSRMCMFCLSCVSVVARSRPKWRRHRRLPGGLDPPPPPLLWVDFGQLEMAPKCPAWVGWGGGGALVCLRVGTLGNVSQQRCRRHTLAAHSRANTKILDWKLQSKCNGGADAN